MMNPTYIPRQSAPLMEKLKYDSRTIFSGAVGSMPMCPSGRNNLDEELEVEYCEDEDAEISEPKFDKQG